MGSNKNTETVGNVTPARQDVYDWAKTQRNAPPSPITTDMFNNYSGAADQSKNDYTNLMGGYTDWRDKSITPTIADINSSKPTTINPSMVSYNRDPATMGRAISGYTDFANTGGYSPQDIQELRARGVSPIRSAFSSAMSGLDRQRALAGGYSPSYAATAANMQRNLPGQLSEATTNVNAGLADAIRQGKLAGLGGLTGIGNTEGGWNMEAAKSNQSANLAGQQANIQALQNWNNQKLAGQQLLGSSLNNQTQLYGTTPGMASTFGNQALNAAQLENQRRQGAANTQLDALGQQRPAQPPLRQTLLDAGTSALPFL